MQPRRYRYMSTDIIHALGNQRVQGIFRLCRCLVFFLVISPGRRAHTFFCRTPNWKSAVFFSVPEWCRCRSSRMSMPARWIKKPTKQSGRMMTRLEEVRFRFGVTGELCPALHHHRWWKLCLPGRSGRKSQQQHMCFSGVERRISS